MDKSRNVGQDRFGFLLVGGLAQFAELLNEPANGFIGLNEVFQERMRLEGVVEAELFDGLDDQRHDGWVAGMRSGEIVDRCLPHVLVSVQNGLLNLVRWVSHGNLLEGDSIRRKGERKGRLSISLGHTSASGMAMK